MMKAFSRWLTRRHNAWLVISVVVLVAGWSVLRATQVENDDDILAFLPQDNPDVETFRQVNRLFGSLDLALVGIESDDVYRPDFLRRLQEATRELKETRGINHVLTMSNVVDFTPDPRGGVVTTPLVYRIPANRREVAELRARVQSKEHVLGRLVSRDGRAVLLYCFLAYGSDPLTMAGRIRKVVREHFPGERKYWGGGPFVSTYIYESTRSDIRRLTPWAVAVVVLILLLAFRDIIGVGLVLLSTGVGILFSLAVMSVLGVRFNIVLGSMPVILFAVGSAYGIHILARYVVNTNPISIIEELLPVAVPVYGGKPRWGEAVRPLVEAEPEKETLPLVDVLEDLELVLKRQDLETLLKTAVDARLEELIAERRKLKQQMEAQGGEQLAWLEGIDGVLPASFDLLTLRLLYPAL